MFGGFTWLIKTTWLFRIFRGWNPPRGFLTVAHVLILAGFNHIEGVKFLRLGLTSSAAGDCHFRHAVQLQRVFLGKVHFFWGGGTKNSNFKLKKHFFLRYTSVNEHSTGKCISYYEWGYFSQLCDPFRVVFTWESKKWVGFQKSVDVTESLDCLALLLNGQAYAFTSDWRTCQVKHGLGFFFWKGWMWGNKQRGDQESCGFPYWKKSWENHSNHLFKFSG